MNYSAAIIDVFKTISNNKACLILSAVAAGIALLSFVVFIVALARKRHKRGAAQVLFLVFGSLFTIAFILTLAVAVTVVYNPFGLFKYVEIAENFIFKLFGISDKNIINNVLGLLGLTGIVLFAAAVVFTIAAMTAVSVKTKKTKNADKPASLPTDGKPAEEPADAPAESNIEADAVNDEIEADTVNDEIEEDTVNDEIEADEEQSQGIETEEEQSQEINNQEIKNIVNEIDALVTGEARGEDSDVDEKLKQAILEGYALTDAYSDLENIPVVQEPVTEFTEQSVYEEMSEETEKPYGDDILSEEMSQEPGYDEDIAAEEELAEEISEDAEEEQNQEIETEEEQGQEIKDEEEPGYEDYAFYNDEQAEDSSYEESESEQSVASEQQPVTEQQPAPDKTVRVTPQSGVALNTAVQPRVRTIIRRPTARNADELIERASAADEPVAKPEPTAKPKPEQQPQSAPKKQTKSGGTTRKPAKKQTAKPVEAQVQEQNLPMTRKYIILNRRNAAAVFNEYLNGKKEQDKKKITDNLNTVIIK